MARFISCLLMCLTPIGLAAQHSSQVSPGAELTQKAVHQIEMVAGATVALSTPEAATEAGYRMAFPWLPTMGEHWVHRELLAAGEVDLERPPVLMFSKLDGEDRLVGVAYGFVGPPDAAIPDAFDGDQDRWHDHVEFAPPGGALHMLHAWLVPSTGGTFAGHNHYVAYWRAGLEMPSPELLDGPGQMDRVKAVGVALALTVEGSLLAGGGGRNDRGMRLRTWLEQQAPEALASMDRAGDVVAGLIPELNDAIGGRDRARFNQAADRAIEALDSWEAAVLDAVPMEGARERIGMRLQEMRTGGHEHPE